MFERIVVPLDGSDLSEQAVGTAESLARPLGVPMHLVRVIDYPATSLTYAYGSMMESEAIASQIEDERAMAETYLGDVARSLQQRGIEVTTEVRHGAPVQELCDAMDASDLVVIASHGRSGIARWFLGSVAEEVVRRATVPVLLVRVPSKRASHRPDPRTAMTG